MLIALLLAVTAAPSFEPLRFFAGRTAGNGQLKVIFRRRVPVSVVGSGKIEADGSLTLDQVIAEGAKPPRVRRWRLRQIGPHRYTGSLTDAGGPVVAIADGRRLHIRFSTPSNFNVEQWLTLAPDGRSADNLLVARRFGVPVARLRERISKVD